MNEWTTDPQGNPGDVRRRDARQPASLLDLWRQLRDRDPEAVARSSSRRAGWTKRDIAEFVYERARIRRAEWADVGKGAVVRDRGDSVYTALEFAGPSAGGCGRRPGRRLRRHHSALDGQQDQGGDGRDRRVRRLRAAEGLAEVRLLRPSRVDCT